MKRTKDKSQARSAPTLRAYRQQAGLSQEKLAAKAGLDRTYVGGAERGERNVALVNIVRLAEALGIQPADLLGTPGKQPHSLFPSALP